jgi:hypothetical protein
VTSASLNPGDGSPNAAHAAAAATTRRERNSLMLKEGQPLETDSMRQGAATHQYRKKATTIALDPEDDRLLSRAVFLGLESK